MALDESTTSSYKTAQSQPTPWDLNEGQYPNDENGRLNQWLPVKVQWGLTAATWAGVLVWIFLVVSGQGTTSFAKWAPAALLVCCTVPVAFGFLSWRPPITGCIGIAMHCLLPFATHYAGKEYFASYIAVCYSQVVLSFFFYSIDQANLGNAPEAFVWFELYGVAPVYGLVNAILRLGVDTDIYNEQIQYVLVPCLWIVLGLYNSFSSMQCPKEFDEGSTYRINAAQYLRLHPTRVTQYATIWWVLARQIHGFVVSP